MISVLQDLEDYQLEGLVFVSRKNEEIKTTVQVTQERKVIILASMNEFTLKLQDLERPSLINIYNALDNALAEGRKISLDLTRFPGYIGTSLTAEFWFDIESIKITQTEERFSFSINLTEVL